MKNTILLICLLALGSCTRRYVYSYKLVNATESVNNVYEDSLVRMKINAGNKLISLNLKNKTSEVIEIDWQHAAIVREGVALDLTKRGSLMGIIPANAIKMDFLGIGLHYQKGYGMDGGYEFEDFFNSVLLFGDDEDELMKNKGKRISLLIPVDSGGNRWNYEMLLEVESIRKLSNIMITNKKKR